MERVLKIPSMGGMRVAVNMAYFLIGLMVGASLGFCAFAAREWWSARRWMKRHPSVRFCPEEMSGVHGFMRGAPVMDDKSRARRAAVDALEERLRSGKPGEVMPVTDEEMRLLSCGVVRTDGPKIPQGVC